MRYILITIILALSPLGVQSPVVTAQEQVLQVIKVDLPEQCNPYRELVAQYDWDANIAMKIMYAESGCNPNAVNRTDNHRQCLGSYGLFQISCTTSTTTDPATNIKLAYEEKYLKGGYKHWSVCKNGLVNCGI